MNEDTLPYTKREEDNWRAEARGRFDDIQKDMRESTRVLKESLIPFIKASEELAKISSHNSGQILAIWDRLEKDKNAVEFINDSLVFGKSVKWIVYLIISAATLYASLKALFFNINIHQ